MRFLWSLRPGVPGISDNIQVRSILGRFLEHSRVYHFHANGTDLVFLSSADWMDRNLIRRIEAATPLSQAADKRRIIHEAFETHLMASENAWLLQSDGTWKRATPEATGAYNSQQVMLDALSEAAGTRTSD